MLALAALIAAANAAATTRRPLPFEARSPPRRGPFFNGWCLRAMDETGCSATAIVGCFSRGARSEHLVAVAARARTPDGGFETAAAQRVYRGDECRLDGAPRGAGPSLRFEAPCGVLAADGGDLRATFALPGGDGRDVAVDLAAAAPSPWAAGGGPEGWLGRRLTGWALPCRYAVRCVDSPAVAAATAGASRWASSSALLHAEANHGRSFPKQWVWCQGAARGRSVLAVGGTFRVGPLPLADTWLVRYASPAVGEWAFRTTDLRTKATSDLAPPAAGPATARLTLERRTRGERRILDLVASADEFLPDALFVPTPGGFSDDPGTREALAATVTVTASVVDGGRRRVVDEATIEGACLEFGGRYVAR